jgi:hypothetical protein
MTYFERIINMTGILEQVLAELQGIKALLNNMSITQDVVIPANQAKPNGSGQPQTVAVSDPFNMSTPTPTPSPAAVSYTDDQIMALIEPYLNNAPVKQDFQVVLQSMNIPKLIEARPDQYNELYAKFTAVIQKHGPQAVNSPVSIL